MKIKLIRLTCLLAALLALATEAYAQTTAFTYQGRLITGTNAANGQHDLTFTLYNALSAGATVGTSNTVSDLAITNGLFTVTLDFPGAFDGSDRWLQIAVRPGASTGAYTNLNPRQPITATPYAIRALNAGTAGSATTASSVAAGAVTSSSLAPGSVGGTAIADGSITSLDLSSNLLNTTFWKLTGNDVAPGQFIGSTNNQAVELKVNNQRALRLEPSGVGGSPNVLGGYHQNIVNGSGSTIAGGGTSGAINQADGNYAFIGAGIGGRATNSAVVVGGAYNSALAPFSLVGSGIANTNRGLYAAIVAGTSNTITALADHAFIGGGHSNTANNTRATVGGGENNRASSWATVGGGRANQSDGSYATVAGGRDNSSSGTYATVAGGQFNVAAGQSSFAAGTHAKANHQGSFVWADSLGGPFDSTGSNQFLIRAAGGVGINKTNPATALDVNGTVTASSDVAEGFAVRGAAAGYSLHDRITGETNRWVMFATEGTLGFYSGNAGTTLMSVSSNGAVTASSFNGNAGLPFILGTTDTNALEFKVNGIRALRLEPTADDHFYANAVNVVGGSPVNSVGAGVRGATIAGGGALIPPFSPFENKVTADFGTVGGGLGNTASENGATVGGGHSNSASGESATVGGGVINTASGNRAMVPGGFWNSAVGDHSFAAGMQAKANHSGSFVWADAQGVDFASTGNNQFAVRAIGGVRFATQPTTSELTALDQVAIGPNGTPNAALRLGFHGYNNITSAGLIQATDGGPVPLKLNPFGGGVSVGGGLSVNGVVSASSDVAEGFVVGGTVAGYALHDRVTGAAGRWVMFAANGTLAFWRAGSTQMSVDQFGNLTTAGTVNGVSDRNAKENFQPVDPRAVLDKVAALPLSEWNFKTDTATRHIGPMAQDFHAAFGLGMDDKHIATVDADGVALAAIQGLNQKVEGEVTSLRAENAELKQRLEKLEQLMNRPDGGAR